jgi:hypothetical protein
MVNLSAKQNGYDGEQYARETPQGFGGTGGENRPPTTENADG